VANLLESILKSFTVRNWHLLVTDMRQ